MKLFRWAQGSAQVEEQELGQPKKNGAPAEGGDQEEDPEEEEPDDGDEQEEEAGDDDEQEEEPGVSEAVGGAFSAIAASLESFSGGIAAMQVRMESLESRLGKVEGSRRQEVETEASRRAREIAAEAGVPEGRVPPAEGQAGPAGAEEFAEEYRRIKAAEGATAAGRYWRAHKTAAGV